jgi:hypothetical protein
LFVSFPQIFKFFLLPRVLNEVGLVVDVHLATKLRLGRTRVTLLTDHISVIEVIELRVLEEVGD